MEKLYTIAQQFAHPESVEHVQSYGAGNVNDTYLVTVATAAANQPPRRFVMQRVNTNVFHQPELILLNMQTFLGHMERQRGQEPMVEGTRWEMPQIISTTTNQGYYLDQGGAFWRAISLIERAKTYPQIRDATHARESGSALGRFHRLLSALDPATLHDTLPGFHITPRYLAQYDQILGTNPARAQANSQRSAQSDKIEQEVQWCLQFIEARRTWATVLENALANGELTLRAIHGDPKVDNILIDDESGKAVSIIDLDTVKPGLVHYDIGDCLRSCCNPAGEETTDLSSVTFDTALCRVILEGYFAEAARFFTPADYDYLYDAIRLIALELGMRFFTDYLAGDVYFKVKHSTHNLQRALVQFRLTECIEAQEAVIRQIVADQRR